MHLWVRMFPYCHLSVVQRQAQSDLTVNLKNEMRRKKRHECYSPCHVGHACDEMYYIRLCLSSLVSDSFVCLNNSSHADFTRATCSFLWSVHMQTIQSICLFCSCVCTTIYDFLGFHDIIHLGDENYK